MKNHPDKKEIIRAASGLIENSAIREHIGTCPDCLKYFQDLSSVLSPSDNSHISVSDDVEHRIVNSYRNIKLHTGNAAEKFTGLFKPALASLAIIAVAAASIMVYSIYYKDEQKRISYKKLYGDSYINNVRVNDTLISSGDRIVTKSESSSRLEIGEIFLINIYSDSEIEIEKSLFLKKEKQVVFNFKIISGTFHAKFEKQSDLYYSFTTEFAKIESIGTEFIIKHTKEETTVIVSEGSLLITALRTAERKIAVMDKIYIIKNNIEVNDAGRFIDGAQLNHESLNKNPEMQKDKALSKEETSLSKHDNNNSKFQNIDSADKNEIKKMMKETKKEMNREMKGSMRNEMKKERGGYGK